MNRIVKRADLKEGMIVYMDVVNSYGTLLVNRGTVIDSRVLELLEYNEIPTVVVLNEVEDGGNYITTHLERIKASEKYQKFSKQYEIAYDSLNEHVKDVLDRSKQVNKEKIVAEINAILENTATSKELFDAINILKFEKNNMYMHSLNTALMSNVLGKWLKFEPDAIEDLTVAGLFHDIGMMMVPQELLDKEPEQRTKEEIETIQKHTIYGYRYLMKAELNRQIGLTALMHHENMDGSGYPLQCMGTSLCTFAKVVAIVDAYDEQTLTKDGGRNPFVLIRAFQTEGLTKYEPQYLMAFLNGIMDTYIGTDVLLSNGQVGTIIYINRDDMARPMVRVGENQYINLADEPKLTISKFV